MGLTVEARNSMLNHFYGNENYTQPSEVYIGLFNNSGELSGGGYERQPITFSNANNGRVENNIEIKFPIASEDWGTIINTGIFDSEEGGMRLDEATGDKKIVGVVNRNQRLSFPIGNYSVSIDNKQTETQTVGVVDEV